MIIQICVGSSCHLKGSPEIVQLMQEAVETHHLENEITLAGSFCIGKCNPIGVTVQVDGEVYTGITPMNFKEFFKSHVLYVLHPEAADPANVFSITNSASYSCSFTAS